MSDEENYCERHDVDIDSLPKDYTFCPYCREERRIDAARVEQQARDRTLEPY